jgi:hypothetical protein
MVAGHGAEFVALVMSFLSMNMSSVYAPGFTAGMRTWASILQLYALGHFLPMGTTRRAGTYQLEHMHVIRNQSGSTLLPAATLLHYPWLIATCARRTVTRASFLIPQESEFKPEDSIPA